MNSSREGRRARRSPISASEVLQRSRMNTLPPASWLLTVSRMATTGWAFVIERADVNAGVVAGLSLVVYTISVMRN